MESLTYIKNLRISPKKLRFLLPEIKKLKPYETLPILQYTTKKGAKIFYKAIKSAISNAKSTFKVDDHLLKFKVLTIEEGLKQKRWRPGGRGTPAPFKRRYSHIKIILGIEENKQPKKELVKPVQEKVEVKKVEEKKEVKKEKKEAVAKVKKPRKVIKSK